MDYTALIQALTILASQASAANGYVIGADFANILPWAIAYAEGRIYREMTFLAARAQDASLTFSGTGRNLTLTQATTIILVPEGLALITPKGQIPALGKRVPFLQTTLDFIDINWPTESKTADPTVRDEWWWTMKDDATIVVGPTPNDTYAAEVTGLFQPAPVSATNTTTYLSLVYPNLLQAGCMIYITGYMRNFGAQADNPKMALSWESEYTTLAASAKAEEDRRRGAGTGWSPNNPTPLAKPERTG